MAARFQQWFYKNIWTPESRAGGTFNLENPKTPINGFTVDQVLGGVSSTTGQSIGYDSALTLSAVWRAIQIKAGLIASLPFQLYRRVPKGREVISAREYTLAALFAGRPNSNMTKAVYFERAMNHYEAFGEHIALPKWNGIGRVTSIDLIHPRDVDIYQDKAGKLAYKIKGVEGALSTDQVIHVPNMGDGIRGKAVLTVAREDFGMQMDNRDYGQGLLARGGVPRGIFIPQMRDTNNQREELLNSWDSMKTRRRDVAIPFGWQYQQLSLPPADAAFIETGQFGVENVSRWFGVPLPKLASMSGATFSNAETMGIWFLQDTMSPIAKKFEIEYSTKLLSLPSEVDMYLEFNMDAYLRADSVAKAESLSKLVQFGLRTPNEVRELDNYENKPGGDDLYMQAQMTPISALKDLAVSKTAPPATTRKRKEKPLTAVAPELLTLFENGNGKH